MYGEGCCEVASCGPSTNYVQSNVTVTEKDNASQCRQYFLNRINELHWQKRDELSRLAGFDKLEKIKESFQDAIWAETDPSKLPALLAQFDQTAVQQATFSAKELGLGKLFN